MHAIFELPGLGNENLVMPLISPDESQISIYDEISQRCPYFLQTEAVLALSVSIKK